MKVAEVTLRPVVEADEAFLCDVYASTRREELAPLGWPEPAVAAFLAQQAAAQHAHYRAHYTGASWLVILVDDEPAGRLYLHRSPGELRIIDIALLASARGRGVGSRLLGEILDEGDRTATPVRIHVEKHNPALRLYQRLGFTAVEDRGVHWFMERAPAAPARAPAAPAPAPAAPHASAARHAPAARHDTAAPHAPAPAGKGDGE
jgi:ribosomal protein S18 acetylase RimI-like enzyme